MWVYGNGRRYIITTATDVMAFVVKNSSAMDGVVDVLGLSTLQWGAGRGLMCLSSLIIHVVMKLVCGDLTRCR